MVISWVEFNTVVPHSTCWSSILGMCSLFSVSVAQRIVQGTNMKIIGFRSTHSDENVTSHSDENVYLYNAACRFW